MRIALASIHPRPLSGQIENLVGLAQALQARDHQVTVVSAFPNDVLLSRERMKLMSRHKWSFVDHPARVARILRELIRLSSQLDLIQLHLPTPSFTAMADVLQTFVRVPVLVFYEAHLANAHDLLQWDRLRAAPEFYLPRLVINNGLFARISLRRAARYMVSSEFQKQELRNLGIPASRIALVRNPLPDDKVMQISREDARMQLNLPDAKIITYLGHYNHIKGVDLLANAFRKIAARDKDVFLVSAWSGIGNCPQMDVLCHDAALGSRVISLGRVPVPQLLAASSVVALPYRLTMGQAVYPAVLLEAIAANVPTVTSDLPLLRELTQGGKTAQLVPTENADALADALSHVLNEPALARTMQVAQREWMLHNRPQSIAKEYERIYAELATPETEILQPARHRADVS